MWLIVLVRHTSSCWLNLGEQLFYSCQKRICIYILQVNIFKYTYTALCQDAAKLQVVACIWTELQVDEILVILLPCHRYLFIMQMPVYLSYEEAFFPILLFFNWRNGWKKFCHLRLSCSCDCSIAEPHAYCFGIVGKSSWNANPWCIPHMQFETYYRSAI